MSVHPPRASAGARRWRRATPVLRGAAVRAGDGAARLGQEVLGHWQPDNVPASGVVRRMILPGWPQIYCGRVLRGKVFLGLYLVLLAGSVLFAGTTGGALLLGLAISCHVSSVLDLALINVHGVGPRLLRSVLIFFTVALLIYVPLGWLLGQVLSPQQIRVSAPPFEAGDVVLVNPSAYRVSPPAVGDIVLYEIPRTTVDGHTNGGIAAQVVITGDHIDRILAVGGQRVECQGKTLRVDGTETTVRPLNPYWTGCPLALSVPTGSCLIIPSTNLHFSPQSVSDVCLVSQSRIRGRVVLQTQPLTRFGLID